MGSKKIPDGDLYELLGVSSTSNSSEIKRAYRKKVLKCHPDKCPDDPKAVAMFHELSRALEILTDEAAKAAYDAVLRARQAAKVRRRDLSDRYRKLRDDLEERERRAQEDDARLRDASCDCRTQEDKLQAEVERLRKEGSRQVREEQEAVRRELAREARLRDAMEHAQEQYAPVAGCRLRVHWRARKDDPANGGYDHATLHALLSKHGDVAALIMSAKKKGSALVEYSTPEAAELAREVERGLHSNPLSLRRLGEPAATFPCTTPPAAAPQVVGDSAPAPIPAPIPAPACAAAGDFEDVVLARLRQAAAKQQSRQGDPS